MGNAILGDAGLHVILVPAHGRLYVLRILHFAHQAQVVEERHKLVCAIMLQTIATSVFDELELGVDPLANGC